MNENASSDTFEDPDDYPEITEADFQRGVYRIGRQPVPRKRRVTIMLDEPIIAHFKALAGERGYQTLINETLRQALRQEALEEGLRRVIREEMARYTTADPAWAGRCTPAAGARRGAAGGSRRRRAVSYWLAAQRNPVCKVAFAGSS